MIHPIKSRVSISISIFFRFRIFIGRYQNVYEIDITSLIILREWKTISSIGTYWELCQTSKKEPFEMVVCRVRLYSIVSEKNFRSISISNQYSNVIKGSKNIKCCEFCVKKLSCEYREITKKPWLWWKIVCQFLKKKIF